MTEIKRYDESTEIAQMIDGGKAIIQMVVESERQKMDVQKHNADAQVRIAEINAPILIQKETSKQENVKHMVSLARWSIVILGISLAVLSSLVVVLISTKQVSPHSFATWIADSAKTVTLCVSIVVASVLGADKLKTFASRFIGKAE